MTGPTHCLVFASGGFGSWASAKRAVVRFGVERTQFLFTETYIEHPDCYRTLIEGTANALGRKLNWSVPPTEEWPDTFLIDGDEPRINPAWLEVLADLRQRAADALPELIWLADGRHVWQVFTDKKLIGNGRKDPCSEILKRITARAWMKANVDPATTCLVFGIGWEEPERHDGDPIPPSDQRRGVMNVYGRLGYPHVWSPMLDKPWMKDNDVRAWARLEGLAIPLLYQLGFSHNNCGGFCVKAGEGHFVMLLERQPKVYAWHEAWEAAFNRKRSGNRPQTVLAPKVKQPDGSLKRVPMTMREFREAYERGDRNLQIDLFNTSGCMSCFAEAA